MIQSGFQGLTEGKQAGCEGERATEGDGEERATDLFDGKLQRCLEDERLTAVELNTVPPGSLYLLRTFPPVSWTHGRVADIYLCISPKIHFLSSLCSLSSTS